MTATTPEPDDQPSSLIQGMSRRAVAQKMGMPIAEVAAIENKLRLLLLQKLAADPQTRHLLNRLRNKH